MSLLDPATLRKVKAQNKGFAVYPNVKLKGYKKKNNSNEMTFGFLKELLFGDYIRPFFENGELVKLKKGRKTYIKVRARNKTGYVLPDEVQADRILEVNFIDVAQGDGCHLVTPDDKHFIIDAGKGDNMFRFLSWRFNLRNPENSPPKFTAVITHSDNDHYGGFGKLFKTKRKNKRLFRFDNVYHNGIVEGKGSKKPEYLGDVASRGQDQFITNLSRDNKDFKNRVKTVVGGPGPYMNLLKSISAPKKSLKYGDKPIYKNENCKVEVLGPVTTKVNRKDSLIVFDQDKGRTKNGHSIILKLTYGKLKVLLGGDLNSSSEPYLFKKFTKIDIDKQEAILNDDNSSNTAKKKAHKEIEKAIIIMREKFEVDIAKSCHHGSADFTNEFLKALNPIATIISSGDNESHAHPRPDTLGTIGKYSRGERSLIFSTELARSSKEYVSLIKSGSWKKKERAVTRYGMINVRTDGEKVVVAQKLEKDGSSKNWDIHKLEWNDNSSEFEYVSKYLT